MITLAGYFKENAVFTLKCLDRFCGGTDQMWEMYYTDQFDAELKRLFDASISPTVTTAAWLMRGYLLEMRGLVGEIRAIKESQEKKSQEKSGAWPCLNCSTCGGTGSVQMSQRGMGTLTDPVRIETHAFTCPACGGSGKQPTH